jgi:hypothetical protein
MPQAPAETPRQPPRNASLRRWYDRSFRWREDGGQPGSAPSATSRPARAASISATVSGTP